MWKQLLLLLAAVAWPCGAEPGETRHVDPVDLFAGRAVPLTVRLGDLGPGWSVCSSGPPRRESPLWDYLARQDAAYLPDLLGPVTRGESVEMLGRRYLVGYQLDLMPPPQDQLGLLLTDETPYHLCLLHLLTAGDLARLRPFDRHALMASLTLERDQVRTRQLARLLTTRLHDISAAVAVYCERHSGRMPPLDTPAVARHALEPFLSGPDVLTDPISGQPFLFNRRLSERKRAHLKASTHMILAFQAGDGQQSDRLVVFLDSEIRTVKPADWAAEAARSRIPSPDEVVPPPPG